MTQEEHIQALITKYDLLFESRLTKVETTLEKLEKNLDNRFKEISENIREIRFDFRWMFGIMLAFCTVILSLIAKGFHWLP